MAENLLASAPKPAGLGRPSDTVGPDFKREAVETRADNHQTNYFQVPKHSRTPKRQNKELTHRDFPSGLNRGLQGAGGGREGEACKTAPQLLHSGGSIVCRPGICV